MPKFFDTGSERRQSPRTKLVEIAYIGMGPENGGLVLDVSDGGLSFHSVAPVRPAETIQFLLSLRGHSRIEGTGEVVWTNEMKTVCGLRFTSLSTGAREHLNSWTNQTQLPTAPEEGSVLPAPPASPQVAEEAAPPATAADADVEPLFAIPPAPEISYSEPEATLPWEAPLFFWIVFGLCCAALTVAAFIYGVHIGKSEIGSVPRPAANTALQAAPQTLAPAPVLVPSIASEASSAPPARPPAAPSGQKVAAPVPSSALVNAPKINDTKAATIPRPEAERRAAIASDHRIGAPSTAGKSELASALAYLNGDSGQRDSDKAVKLLWVAVADGNAEAELLLSDLYANGDAVTKNCEQARVLLIAAVKGGNDRAKVKLDELNASGCS